MNFFRRHNRSVPVLTYHSLNVHQNSYAGNDHCAFESDLRTMDRLGLKIIPLSRVLDWYEGRISYREVKECVAVTLDDGSWLDYHDVIHPSCGTQVSMFNLLKQFQRSVTRVPQLSLHVSSFVIASSEAREELDQKNLLGNGWWGDEWWQEAQTSSLMSIECHSWDHAHPTLEKVAQKENLKGDFHAIDTYEECVDQVTRAAEYIEKTAGKRPAYYAYPWGQASDYMVSVFMPDHQQEHQFEAAFSIESKHLTREDNRWYLPRYVCGRDWKSPEELEAILK